MKNLEICTDKEKDIDISLEFFEFLEVFENLPLSRKETLDYQMALLQIKLLAKSLFRTGVLGSASPPILEELVRLSGSLPPLERKGISKCSN